MPDWIAKEVIGDHPSCINPLADKLLSKLYEKMGGKCTDMNEFGYRMDDNGDWLIEDCLK